MLRVFRSRPGTSPDFAPAVLGNQFLQRAAEIVGRLDGVVHKLGAKHRSANAEAFFKSFFIHVFLLRRSKCSWIGERSVYK